MIAAIFRLLFCLLLVPGVVHATTRYVSTSGSDSNSCATSANISTPKRNITGGSGGISCMNVGDTLYIRGGSYAEVINQSALGSRSGTSFSNAFTIAGYPSETVTIQRMDINTSRYIIFQNLIVSDGPPDTGISIINDPDGSGIPGDNFLRFQDVEVKRWSLTGGFEGNGVQVYSNRNEFINVRVHDSPQNTAERHHCYYIQGAFNLLDGGETYNCTGYGIQLYSGYSSTAVHDNIIRNYRVYNNGGSSNPGGIVLSKGANNLAYNNLIYGNINGANGIDVDYTASNTKIYNNTIYGNANWGISITSATSGTIVINNIIYNNANGAILNNGSGPPLVPNFFTNPQFVNAGTGDFHLQAGSGARDSGMTIAAVPVDIAGVSRPQGCCYDMGAYEAIDVPPSNNYLLTMSALRVAPGGSITASWVVSPGPAGNDLLRLYSLSTEAYLSTPCTTSTALTGNCVITTPLVTGTYRIDYQRASDSSIATSSALFVVHADVDVTISVDSTESGFFTEPLHDGVVNTAYGATGWTWLARETAADHWVAVAFPSPVTITNMSTYFTFSGSFAAYMTPASLLYQVCSGGSWVTKATFTRSAVVASDVQAISPVSTRQIRWFMSSGQGPTPLPNDLWLTEVNWSLGTIPPPAAPQIRFGGRSTGGTNR